MQNNSTIKPADISLTRLSQQEDTTGVGNARRSILVGAGLFVLAVLVFAVIFILPDWLKDNPPPADIPLTAGTVSGTESAAPAAVTRNQPSPWSEAQLARQRKATQDILSQMLKQQETLEQIGVKQWAPEKYAEAVKQAEAGDALYRQRDYGKAQESYQNGLDQFNRLLQQSESVFTEAMANGQRAIDTGDADAAKSAFLLALLIKPDDAAAVKGKQRSTTLDQVLQLLEQGDELLKTNRLEDAESVYQQALDLDPDMDRARDKLSQARQAIIDRNFTVAMSDGYAALENNGLEEARRSFQKALKIKPTAVEAGNALRQTEDKLTAIKINKLLASAAENEQSESWSEAIADYDQALKLDPNLVTALSGKQNASLRDRLDKNLNYAIDNPLRLEDESVYKQTLALYQAAVRMETHGPKLTRQLATLNNLLEKSRTPLAVTIRSDNLTEITLYKTGDLGHFASRQISLVPGRYIVVGRRDGYKDVRVEFTVEPDKSVQPLIVQCEEKISF